MFSRVDNFPKKVFGRISADNFRLENFGSIDVSRIRSVSTHNEMKSRVSNVSFLRGWWVDNREDGDAATRTSKNQ